MLGRALDDVSAGGRNFSRRSDPVYVKLGGAPFAVVGKHANVNILPFWPIRIPETPEARQATIGDHERIAGEASGRSGDGDLRVAKSGYLSDREGVVPHLSGQCPG